MFNILTMNVHIQNTLFDYYKLINMSFKNDQPLLMYV